MAAFPPLLNRCTQPRSPALLPTVSLSLSNDDLPPIMIFQKGEVFDNVDGRGEPPARQKSNRAGGDSGDGGREVAMVIERLLCDA